ncbi:ribonuclease H-like domain-containing protein [Tanacetum coccineum]
MSTQQDIYAAGFENHPPMLNKDNYVPWSSRLLRYAKSKPNRKLIYYFIMNGPYVRRIIPEPRQIAQPVVLGIANSNANQNGNGNVVAARAKGNGNGNNRNQIRCYNYRGLGHFAKNCTVRPRKRDAAYA